MVEYKEDDFADSLSVIAHLSNRSAKLGTVIAMDVTVKKVKLKDRQILGNCNFYLVS